MKNIILLTSTIDPKKNQPGLKLVDVNERYKDYFNALSFYNKLLNQDKIDGIVYVDNSNYNLDEFRSLFSKEIEFISYFGLDYPDSYHRGYGEFKLIDYAFANSKTLSSIDKKDRIWKISGRYIIKNLSRVIKYSPNEFDIYVNQTSKWVDMEILGWNYVGYKKMIYELYHDFSLSKPPELTLADKISLNKPNIQVFNKFLYPPLIIGRRGYDSTKFVTIFGFLKHFVKVVKSLIRFKKGAY